LLGVRTFDSEVSGKLEVGREIDMVLVETHAGKFFCKLLEFIRDKKRFQRYDPAFISGMNRINTTIKKTDARKSPRKNRLGGVPSLHLELKPKPHLCTTCLAK